MGKQPYFCLLYNETVNFSWKSQGHWVPGMLMGMPMEFKKRKKSVDLNSLLPLNCFIELMQLNLNDVSANNYL